ncbi:O-antigen ligase family protein [Stigmatella aurantiaca]|uniref:Conserved uncharacterized protein n=1 Tax=Stigmatella aurantiaca (strain DW4/3-1) TaxID=378806 RepID=Q09E62_STIAD|nr:hypothetical protein [Stigmatella aurantiaca]ADO74728.1 conserved uncharacterized protein [Stigmatella aurantiaca DW4/3-1]EAU70065.1 hypothetical protein STIAU_8385 [Stigmatella aurantiaca DW4/3-1]
MRRPGGRAPTSFGSPLPLQGPGVLHQRYVRRVPAPGDAAPGAGREAPPVPERAERKGLLSSSALVPLFIAVQILTQLALLWEVLAPLRMIFRIFSFGASLLLLALVPGQRLRHPALPFALAAMAVTALNLFHPQTSSLMAGAAQLGIQFAVLGPLIWVTRLRIDAQVLRRTLGLLFLFNAASAALGVLQVYAPGKFQPAMSVIIESMGEAYTQSLQFVGPTGERIFRPFGLTDTPGGATTGAFYAVLLGSGFLLSEKGGLIRLVSVGGIFLGIVCLYLCQVRASAMMLLVCMLAIVAVLALNGRLLRMTKLIAVVGGFAVVGFGWASTMGGDAIVSRWNTLFEDQAGDVYYDNRGRFLDSAFTAYLPEYPLGAGLGRYGMPNSYFGDNSDPSRPPLWVEIQWAAWVLDGGIFVLVLYPLALLATLFWSLRLASSKDDQHEFWLWGSILFGFNLGAIAITFSYPFFMSQTGMVFWLLNAALFGAHHHAVQQARPSVPHATLHAHRR